MPALDCYVFDLDGTVYLGDTPIPGAIEAIHALQDRGHPILALTNNSSQTVASYQHKLARMGLRIEPSHILTSASATAQYLLGRGHRTAYVVGEGGLKETLTETGVRVDQPGEPDAVVVGICRDSLSYSVIHEASNWIRRGAEFVATNRDATFPDANGELFPGAGSIVAAIETASGIAPFVAGKPSAYILRQGLARLGYPVKRAIVIGDRVDTDIDCAIQAGCRAVLVTTGVDRSAPRGVRVIDSLLELLPPRA